MEMKYHDGSTWIQFKTIDELKEAVQHLELDGVLDVFHEPRLTELVDIRTRKVRLFVLTSEEFECVYGFDGGYPEVLCVAVLCSGKAYRNRFNENKTRNVLVGCRVEQKMIDSINQLDHATNLFAAPAQEVQEYYSFV